MRVAGMVLEDVQAHALVERHARITLIRQEAELALAINFLFSFLIFFKYSCHIYKHL